MPKGNYNAETEYEMLDLVFNGGASWVAKKTVKGIEPTDDNAEHWMKMCESVDLTEVIQRIAALEAQMLGTISLDDIDLSAYATKGEVATLTTNLNELDERVDAVEPKVTNLTTDVNSLKSLTSGIPSSFSKVKVLTYQGVGTYGVTNACKVTVEDFVPRVLLYVGFHHNYQSGGAVSIFQNGASSNGQYYTENVILCDFLTTSYQGGMGFKESTSNDPIMRYAKKSEDGKTVYWYVGDGGDQFKQLNGSSRTYYVIAIG